MLNIEAQSAPWGELIVKLQCPTLLVTGEQGTPDSDMEAIVTPEIAQRAHELNTLVEPVQVLDAAHNIRRDQFGGFWAAVHPFLDRIYR